MGTLLDRNPPADAQRRQAARRAMEIIESEPIRHLLGAGATELDHTWFLALAPEVHGHGPCGAERPGQDVPLFQVDVGVAPIDLVVTVRRADLNAEGGFQRRPVSHRAPSDPGRPH